MKVTETHTTHFSLIKHENNLRKKIFTKQIKPTNLIINVIVFSIQYI